MIVLIDLTDFCSCINYYRLCCVDYVLFVDMSTSVKITLLEVPLMTPEMTVPARLYTEYICVTIYKKLYSKQGIIQYGLPIFAVLYNAKMKNIS